MAFGDRRPAQVLVGLAQVEEHLPLADLRTPYDAGRGGLDGEAGRGDVAELLVLVREGAALDLPGAPWLLAALLLAVAAATAWRVTAPRRSDGPVQ